MKRIKKLSIFVLLSLSFSGVAMADQKIEHQGAYYSIGEVEPGFWGMVKEQRQVSEALSENSVSAPDMRKAKLFDILSWVAVAGTVITSDSGEDGDSFDEENFLSWLPVIIGSSFAHGHYKGKAIEKYNAELDAGFSLHDDVPMFSLRLRF